MTKTGDTERRLIAIFAADVEGYSRLMGADEVGTLKDLTQRRDIMPADSKRPIASLHSCCQRPCLALEFGDQDKQVQNADPARQR